MVSMGIVITSGQNTVSVINGTVVGGSPGIWAQTGCQNITIGNVLVKGATNGILFDSVVGGVVQNCTLTQNITGLG